MNGPDGIIRKKQLAISVLRRHRAVLIALSGGVDSATLLAVAREALGPDNVLAVTGRSASVTEDEIRDARRVAEKLNVRHELVDTLELDRPEYVANAGDRCFHCRSELFEILTRIAVERGFDAVAYGAIVDDLGDHRPGMDVAKTLGILAPLVDAGMGKNEVRQLANEFDLHIHDKPSSPCLASRIPMGTEVTPERLTQVGEAEAALRRLGFQQFRVRHHGEIARIELGAGEVDRAIDPQLRAEIVLLIRNAGFRYATVDLEGYRTPGGAAEAAERLYLIGPARETGQ